MTSHFVLNRKAAVTCAVAGSLALFHGNCSAQNYLVAADYATNSTYAGGWSAGQNGGDGFGPRSMGNYEVTPPHEEAVDRPAPSNTFWVGGGVFNPHRFVPDTHFSFLSP